MICQVITADKAIIEVGAEIYFQIIDVEKSVTNVQDLDRSTRVLVQTALCNLLAQMDLADIESERRTLADKIMVSLTRLYISSTFISFTFLSLNSKCNPLNLECSVKDKRIRKGGKM